MVQHGRPSRSSWAKSVLLSFWQDYYGKGNSRKFHWNTVGRRFQSWECFFVNRENGLFLSMCVDDIKIGWEEAKHWPNAEKTYERSWFGRTDIIPWPCFFRWYSTRMSNKQRFCGQLKKYVLNPESLQELKRSYFILRNLAQTFPHGLMIWKGMQRNVWSDIANWRTEQTQQLYKVATPCLDDHQFEEEMRSVGELSVVCSQIVLKCLYLARIGRPDILWSVNKLERAVTKWTRVCDKRLARLISYIHHTSEFKQDCHVGNTTQQCKLGLFQDSWFCRRSCRLNNRAQEDFCSYLEVIHSYQ